MSFKPLVLGALAAGCITAAAGGAYVAVRQNRPVEPAEVAGQVETPGGSAAVPAPVTETEGVVTPPASVPSAVAEAPDAAPAPAPRP